MRNRPNEKADVSCSTVKRTITNNIKYTNNDQPSVKAKWGIILSLMKKNGAAFFNYTF